MKIFKTLVFVSLFLLFPSITFASTPTYSIRPRTGQVKNGGTFTVDILIDSDGEEISYARAAIAFDPEYLEVLSAQRNESLFCSYPEADQSVDNDNGLVMVTGYCQSGNADLYKTSGGADVFARVKFEAKKVGDTDLEWQYSGEDEPFMSVIIGDGSPPQNLLNTKPRDGNYDIVKRISTGTRQPTTTPETGIGLSIGFVASGFVLVALGFVYARFSEKRRISKLKTVVVYDKE